MMSGHCQSPATSDPASSHERCARNGSGTRANPDKEFVPCTCSCHLGESYECGGCGREIRETVLWTGDGETETYVHIDKDGRAIGEFCA